MVPLGSVLRVGRTYGPDQVMHYNGYPGGRDQRRSGAGPQLGTGAGAIAALLERTLPNGMTFEWTELAYQDAISGNTMLLIFPLCVLLVYGVLAAQYESWSLPLSVILIVPMTLLSAIAGVWLTGGDNNVFTQISFLVLAGLACKNAILIVEFARQREHEGAPRRTAILDACRIRLRPVLMTSVAFIMGVVPLVLASGAGAEVRQAMGIAVFAGMLGVTLFGLLLTPVFYVVVQGAAERLSRRRAAAVPQRRRRRGGSLIVRVNPRSRSLAARALLVAALAAIPAAGAPRASTPPVASVRQASAGRLGRGGLLRSGRSTRAGGGSSTIRCSRSSRTRRSRANRDIQSALARSIRRARCSTRTAAAATRQSRRRVRRRARTGQPGLQRRAAAHHHLPRRPRRFLGAGPVRPRAVGDRGGVGERPELRGRAGERARQRRGGGRAQLLRAARHCSSSCRCSIAASPTSARRCG